MEENIKKQKIIQAAIGVIKEKSVEDATMREIASKAGLTTGAIYYHYKNKEELFYDVIDNFVHFGHKMSAPEELPMKNKDDLLLDIKKEVSLRLSKLDEQKLHILLLSDVISKDGTMKEKYKSDYNSIIGKISDLYYYIFGIENKELKTIISSIFIAALDGIAIQTSLGLIPKNEEKFIEIFNSFFAESIPLFLERYTTSKDEN